MAGADENERRRERIRTFELSLFPFFLLFTPHSAFLSEKDITAESNHYSQKISR
jgi:hypothetical protein